ETQLVRPQVLRTHPVAEQAQLFFDAVLHLSSCTVELFIKFLGRPTGGCQGRDHVARVLLAGELFRLGDYPAALAPGLPRLVEELREQTCWPSGTLLLSLGLVQLPGDLPAQAFVPCEAENIVHCMVFAP